jgi:AcrR family transcriptional regulator
MQGIGDKIQVMPEPGGRPASRRTGGRSARVRSAVLEATIDTLLTQTVDDLSIAEVARHAGVHETSIYRRWGNKANLILDAALSRVQVELALPDTGSLRGDLLALLRAMAAFEATPFVEAVLRLNVGEDPPEVAANRARVWVEADTLIGAVLDRAEARGELPVGIDRRLALETLIGPLQVRLLLSREPFDDAYHEQIVDVVLGGLAAAAPRAASGPAAPRRRS